MTPNNGISADVKGFQSEGWLKLDADGCLPINQTRPAINTSAVASRMSTNTILTMFWSIRCRCTATMQENTMITSSATPCSQDSTSHLAFNPCRMLTARSAVASMSRELGTQAQKPTKKLIKPPNALC